MDTPIPPALQRVRGAGRLAVEATRGLTDLVEAMHAGIARVPGSEPAQRARGITGLVYRSVRGVTGLVGGGVDLALRALEPLLPPSGPVSPGAEALLAALNGVLGDYLAATANPLAIPMRLRLHGRPLRLERAALTAALPEAGPRPLLLIHGLCMNDLQWRRGGADFAAAFAAGGHSPLHLHYNSGLHISDNGRSLALLLEQLLQAWPGEMQDLTLLGHSMGGLLARSALHQAVELGLEWPHRVGRLLTLGTPHLGAPLERGGQQLQLLLGLSAYSRPLVRLAQRRSAGIQDLRYGALREQDWGRHSALPLPAGLRCYAIAGTVAGQASTQATGLPARLLGDGLVPLDSALGRHRLKRLDLRIPPERQWISAGTGHMALQTEAAVLAKLQEWLALP